VPDQFGGGRRLRGRAGGAEVTGEHLRGLGVVDHPQRHGPGAVPGDQIGQPGPTGDHRGAARRAGQQRLDLGRAPGVVQHQQHPAAGHQTAVERDLAVRIRRHGGRGDAQPGEQTAHRHVARHRLPPRVEAAQVHVELAVGEPVGVVVRPPQGEPGLAHATGPVDDRHPRGTATVRGQQGRVQIGQSAGATGEGGRQRWQLPGPWRRRGRGAPQDLPVQRLERRAGVDAQLVGEPSADPVVAGQRVGPPVAAVQGQDELTGEPFVERLRGGARGERADQLGVPAAGQQQVGLVALRGLPFPVQLRAQLRGPGCVEQIQRYAAPEAQCRGVGRRLGGLGDEPAEPVQVHRVRFDGQQVARRLPDDHRVPRLQGLAEPADVRSGGLPRPPWRIGSPHPLDQAVGRHAAPGVDGERGQHVPLPGVPDVDRAAAGPHTDLTEQPELRRLHRLSLPRPGPSRCHPPDLRFNAGTTAVQRARPTVESQGGPLRPAR
jgi:hypothetical protein